MAGRILQDLSNVAKAHAVKREPARTFADEGPVGLRSGQTRALIGKITDRARDEELVAAFLAGGNQIEYHAPKRKRIRREQVYGVRIYRGNGKSEYVAQVIPMIDEPVIKRKGGAISYCAPRSRG